jgi:CheY-like chemotaxis protein
MKEILVIDDDPAVGHALQRVLERVGHRVVVALRAADGLGELRRRAIDVAITDMAMPEQDGVETIGAIAREFPQVRIVAISGGGRLGADGFRPRALSTAAFLAAAKGVGAHATLTKPFQTHELLLAVGCRVLVVDDEPDIRLALTRVLEKVGYSVTTATDGVKGLELLRTAGADILVTDMVMPRMNGVELIRTASREMPHLRIAAISGGGVHGAGTYPESAIGTSAYLSAARDAGAHTVLTKPFEVHDILVAVGYAADPG